MYVTRRLLRSTLEESKSNEPTSDDELPASPRKRWPLVQSSSIANESSMRSINATNKSNKSNVATKSKVKTENGVKQSENEGDKRNKKTASESKQDVSLLRGMGLLIDARDTSERWCEAKILDLNPAEKSVYIHYVGWNARYDTWLPAKNVAAHGNQTGAKTKAGSSWNGKDSLFADPTKPTVGVGANANKKPTKVKKEAPTSPTLVVVAARNTKSNKRSADTCAVKDKVKEKVTESKRQKTLKTEPVAKQSHKTARSSKLKTVSPTIHVAVDVHALDEESERKSRRSRKGKVDLELDMDVGGEPVAAATAATVATEKVKTPTKRTPRSSPTAQHVAAKAKSPKAVPTAVVSSARKPSPRHAHKPTEAAVMGAGLECNSVKKALSPTVGMSVLRRSARATAVGKKRKKSANDDDDESDEDFVVDEDADEEEEEEEDEEEDEEEEVEDEELEELEDSDVDRPAKSKARRGGSSSSSGGRIASGASNQWQTDPAYLATREKLATIFRNRLQRRGELTADFHGSFQDAMSSSSAASTPRSNGAPFDPSMALERPAQPQPQLKQQQGKKQKQKKQKKQRTAAAVESSDEEEKAHEEAVAAYYYMQHYYHMQAYQYHQYMYHQAMVAHQLHQPPALPVREGSERNEDDDDCSGREEGKSETASRPPPQSAASSQQPQPHEMAMMHGGIIDPRVIHARMDALEMRRAHQQLYLQHYNQTTERNLQMLASSPEFLQNGAHAWREQVVNGHEPPRPPSSLSSSSSREGGPNEAEEEDEEEAQEEEEEEEEKPTSPPSVEEQQQEEESLAAADDSKDDEARTAEAPPSQPTKVEESKSPEPSEAPTPPLPQPQQTPSPAQDERVAASPIPENKPSPSESTGSPQQPSPQKQQSSPSPAPASTPHSSTSTAQDQAVLFELVL